MFKTIFGYADPLGFLAGHVPDTLEPPVGSLIQLRKGSKTIGRFAVLYRVLGNGIDNWLTHFFIFLAQLPANVLELVPLFGQGIPLFCVLLSVFNLFLNFDYLISSSLKLGFRCVAQGFSGVPFWRPLARCRALVGVGLRHSGRFLPSRLTGGLRLGRGNRRPGRWFDDRGRLGLEQSLE